MNLHFSHSQLYLKETFNGRESAVNKVQDGSNYPGKKLVPSSLCKKVSCLEMPHLILGIGNAI